MWLSGTKDMAEIPSALISHVGGGDEVDSDPEPKKDPTLEC